LKLEQIAGAHIGRLTGHLSAYEIQGALDGESIWGNLTVHLMAGALRADAMGNAKIQGLCGTITLHAGGKAQVEFMPPLDGASAGASSIRAGGKIELKLDPTADATVSIPESRGVRTRVFGAGRHRITLQAAGGVALGESLAPIMKMETA
jgi:hypothetical protein